MKVQKCSLKILINEVKIAKIYDNYLQMKFREAIHRIRKKKKNDCKKTNKIIRENTNLKMNSHLCRVFSATIEMKNTRKKWKRKMEDFNLRRRATANRCKAGGVSERRKKGMGRENSVFVRNMLLLFEFWFNWDN